ncbi:MAG: pyridoxal phosphate-dependent decarboxylase family protein [Gemmatimonadales bacterium]
MTPEDFRRYGHEIVDWLADYFGDIEARPVVPSVQPGQIRASLPAAAPEAGEPFDRILADFRDRIVPGMVHWGHPGWFGYFPSNGSPPAVLADLLTAGLGAQCMSWATSPAATELEQVVMSWYREMLALPPAFTGVIQDSASTSTLLAFLTARDRAGADSGRLVAYWSAEAHSSVAKAARLTGLPIDRRRIVPVDARFAMVQGELEAMMAEDVAAGLVPGIVVGTMGTTSSTACDPLAAIGEIARRRGAWFHVDAAWGGSAAILPEVRPLLDGVELADSMVTNPHKWLLAGFDCSAYFVRDVDALTRTFGANPEYLRTAQDRDAAVVNFRDWGIPLGRRFRALKLWFVLRHYGVEGLRDMIRRHIAMGQDLARRVAAEDDFQLMAPAPLGLVCLRHVPPGVSGDEPALAAHNAAVLADVNAAGDVMLTHTMLGGKYTIRVAIGALRTAQRHVDRAWTLIRDAARRHLAGVGGNESRRR